MPTFPDAAPASERILPDSKAEYAPPRALPAAHHKTSPGLAPVSVAPEAPVPSSALTTPVAIPSRRPPFVAQVASSSTLDDDIDETRTRETIPPRSRTLRQRKIGVLVGLGTVLGAVVVVSLLRATSSTDSGDGAAARTDSVSATKASSVPPQAAAPAPPKPRAAEPAQSPSLAEAPSTEEAKSKATAERAPAHAPQHPSKPAKPVAAKPEAPTAPVTRPAPRPAVRQDKPDKPRSSSRPASPPSQAGGGIVRESPF